jgi:hypothetical protein
MISADGRECFAASVRAVYVGRIAAARPGGAPVAREVGVPAESECMYGKVRPVAAPETAQRLCGSRSNVAWGKM